VKSFNKIWIPSAGKLCKFNEITHLQEKIILKSLGQSNGAYSSFLYALGVIMTENALEPIKFTTIDRLFYGIYTRAYCFGNDLEYQIKCHACNRTVKYSLNLADIVQALEFLSKKFNKVVELPISKLQVNLTVPDLSRDIAFREYIEADRNDYALLSTMESILYMEYCTMGEIMFPLYEYDVLQTADIIDSLEHEDTSFLHSKVEDFKTSIFNTNADKLLELSCVCGQNLISYDLSSTSFDNFLTMIYNGDLNTFYSKELNFRVMFPGGDVNSMAPIERDLLINLKNSINQQAEIESDPKNGEIDLASM